MFKVIVLLCAIEVKTVRKLIEDESVVQSVLAQENVIWIASSLYMVSLFLDIAQITKSYWKLRLTDYINEQKNEINTVYYVRKPKKPKKIVLKKLML